MYRPCVGKAAIYSGAYCHHWEAGCAITVRVFPLAQLVIGSIIVSIVALGYWVETVSWTPGTFVGMVVALWIWRASFERWLPSGLPDESRCTAGYGALKCDVKFEGIVGPRETIVWLMSRWDRKVQIVRWVATGPA